MHSWAFLSILEPSWAVLGLSRARLGLSWACLGPSWGSLGGILGLSWTHVGTFWARFGASWGRLEAVLDCHGAAGVVLSGFEPSWAVLGRFWAHSGDHFGGQNRLISSNCWGHFLDSILGTRWTTFGVVSGLQFGTRSAQEGVKMGPKGPSRASKTQKAATAKTFKNDLFFKVFRVQRPPRKALGGPRRLPRVT